MSRDFLITLVTFYLDMKIFFICSGIFTLAAYVSTLPSLFCKQIGQIYIFGSQKKKYKWIRRSDKMSKLTENHEIQNIAIIKISFSPSSLTTLKIIWRAARDMRKKALSTLLVGVELHIAFL